MSDKHITNKHSKPKKLRSAPTQYPQAAGPASVLMTSPVEFSMQAGEQFCALR